MSVVVELTPTNIQFMIDGKLYNVTEIIKDGLTGRIVYLDELKVAENPIDNVIIEEK